MTNAMTGQATMVRVSTHSGAGRKEVKCLPASDGELGEGPGRVTRADGAREAQKDRWISRWICSSLMARTHPNTWVAWA